MPANAADVAIALEEIAAYGVVVPMVAGENMLALAEVAAADALRRIEVATGALSEPFDLPAAERISQAIFGEGFWMIPEVHAPEAGDLFSAALTVASVKPARAEVRRFLRDVGSVRENVSRLNEAMLLGDVLDRPDGLRVAQLSAAPAPWVGGAMDLSQPSPSEPITNLVLLHARDEYDGTGATVALTIDQWTDAVPLREQHGEQPGRVDDRRTSGLAINAAAASACAPQAILLAVSPDGQRWTTQALVATIREAFDLAKLRGVTLERDHGAGRVLPALYARSWSLQGEKVLDLRYAALKADFRSAVTYVKDPP
jgi:hypothetical protein